MQAKIHLARRMGLLGEDRVAYTACGHIYGPLEVTDDPAEVTCRNCRPRKGREHETVPPQRGHRSRP